MGSIYRVQDIKPVPTRYGERQIWTMEDAASKRVSIIWAPKALLRYSVDHRGVMNTGVIPILECITFLYKGYTRTSRNKKRYRFALNKATGDVRQRVKALIYFSHRFTGTLNLYANRCLHRCLDRCTRKPGCVRGVF